MNTINNKNTNTINNKNTNTNPLSICIPRVAAQLEGKYIRDIFEKILGERCVSKVDLIRIPNDSKFQRAFIQIRYWPENIKAQHVRERLLQGAQLKIVYDEPYFWRCSVSRTLPTINKKTNMTNGNNSNNGRY